MRVLFTGSRTFADDRAVIDMLEGLVRKKGAPEGVVLVHGGSGNLDWAVEVLGRHMGIRTEVHLADWQKLGAAAEGVRNQEMVDLGADIVVAYPTEGEEGSLDCLRRARIAGLPTIVYDASTGEYVRR